MEGGSQYAGPSCGGESFLTEVFWEIPIKGLVFLLPVEQDLRLYIFLDIGIHRTSWIN